MIKMLGWVGVALWAMGFAVASAAETELRDPQGILSQLDALLGQPDFAKEYCVGDSVELEQLGKNCVVQCGGSGCGQTCENYSIPPILTREVTKIVPATSATLLLEDGTTDVVDAKTFSAQSGNRVRQEMARYGDTFGVKGYAEAVLLQDRSFQTASGETLAAKEIVFDFHPDGFENSPFKVRLSVMPGYPAVAQIVRMASFGNWVYQFKSMKRGPCAR